MKQHSCGAILYAIHNYKLYIILGLEKNIWLPFKGVREDGESNTDAAIREIYEETYGVIKINTINLDCNFITKKKHYHLGIVKIDYNNIKLLNDSKELLINNYDNRYKNFLEKTDIGVFEFNNLHYIKFHRITETVINYYYEFFYNIYINLHKTKSFNYYNFKSLFVEINKNQKDLLKW